MDKDNLFSLLGFKILDFSQRHQISISILDNTKNGVLRYTYNE